MRNRFFIRTILTCAVLLPGTLSLGWHPFAAELTPLTIVQGCPIPLQVTLKFESSDPPTATSRGKNNYSVSWTGTLPGGISTISSHKVTVVDQLGSASVTIPGYYKGTTVSVEHTRSTPLTSITPFATVESLADTRPCDTTRTFSGGTDPPVNGSSASACSVPLAFTQSPRVVQVLRTVNGVQFPDGWAVKTDWNVTGPLATCLTIKAFALRATVRFSDGTRNTVSESVGASERTRTVKVSNSALATGRPDIQEVTLGIVTELKLSGSSPH